MSSIPRFISAVMLLSAMVAHPAAATTIDFETPPLGGAERAVIDPYVAAGVTFTALPLGFSGVVGLVKNRATSACVEPPDENQKLGTAPSSSPGSIGLSRFPIRADFSAASPANMVSVEFQTGAGGNIRLRLFNAADVVVGEATDVAGPPDGTCGFPGPPRARTSLLAVSAEPVAYAIMDAPESIFVFVLDNFTFEMNPTPVATSSWGSLKLVYR